MNNNHQPENELVNTLKNTIPEAEKAFQDNLEAQLMARLQDTTIQDNMEDNRMRLFTEKHKRNQGASRSILTSLAAVIAIVFAGGLFLFVQGSSNLTLQETACDYSGDYHSYQVQSEDTLPRISEQFAISIDNLLDANCFDDNVPDLSPGQVITIPILPETEVIENISEQYDEFSAMVIAQQDIPLNTLITEDMLLTVLVPNDFMNQLQPPLSSFMNVLSSPELAIGQYSATLIQAYEPVLSENIRQANQCDDANSDCSYLPTGTIAFALITDDQTVLSMSAGQHIDILMPLQYITRFNGEKQIVNETHLPLDVVPELRLERLISDAILIDTQIDGDNILVTLALKAPDAILLERLSESDYRVMHIVPHVPLIERNINEQANAIILIQEITEIGNIVSESIHITNTGQLIDMSGWSIEDEDGNSFVFNDLFIYSNATHQIFTGDGVDNPIRSYIGLDEAIYQSGETISLYDAEGVLHTEYQIP